MKKILGGAILFLSVSFSSNSLKSQTPIFAEPEWDPFGLDITQENIFSLDCNFVDIDDDGDLDMLTPSFNYGTYQGTIGFDINSGTAETPEFSGTTKSIFTLENAAFNLEVADIDGDGDYDLVIFGYYGLRLIENVGTAEDYLFENEVELAIDGMPNAYYIRDLDFVDMDGDGDQDLLALLYYQQGVTYFENVTEGGEILFESASIDMVAFEEDGFYYSSIDCADLDNDGDVDCFYRSFDEYYQSKTIYLENTGTSKEPEFNTFQLEDFGMENVTNFIYFADFQFIDMDNDGDLDLMSNGFYEDDPINIYDFQVVYYENLAISTNTQNAGSTRFEIFPNPANNQIFISGDTAIQSAKIVTSSGQIIRELIQLDKSISVKDLHPGMYFLQIQTSNGLTTKKFFIN